MLARMIVMLIVVGGFFAALFGWKFYVGNQMMMGGGPPPATVATMTAVEDTWQPFLVAVGSLRASQEVDVTAQTAGMIASLHFESGGSVAANQLLVQQNVDDDRARLKALEADQRLAEINLRRARQLVADKLVPQSDLDTAESTLARVSADIENIAAIIAKKSIRAPFAGRLGIRQVDIGRFLEPGDAIVSLQADDQIMLDFTLPQKELPKVTAGQAVAVAVDVYPGESFQGSVLAIEPGVRRETRSFRVRAILPNDDLRLAPGMFGLVQVFLPERENVVTIPQAAIAYSPYGESVFVVQRGRNPSGGESLTVKNTFVTLGSTRGDQVAVVEGIAPGDEVVTAGQLKLRDGAPIQVDNSVQVSNSPRPVPAET